MQKTTIVDGQWVTVDATVSRQADGSLKEFIQGVLTVRKPKPQTKTPRE